MYPKQNKIYLIQAQLFINNKRWQSTNKETNSFYNPHPPFLTKTKVKQEIENWITQERNIYKKSIL